MSRRKPAKPQSTQIPPMPMPGAISYEPHLSPQGQAPDEEQPQARRLLPLTEIVSQSSCCKQALQSAKKPFASAPAQAGSVVCMPDPAEPGLPAELEPADPASALPAAPAWPASFPLEIAPAVPASAAPA